MNKSELLSTLQQLHLELAKTETIDASTRQALQNVMNDIQRVVDRSDAEQSTAARGRFGNIEPKNDGRRERV